MIPSPSVKIQIMDEKVCLWCKVRTFWEAHIIWKNLSHGRLICQNHEEDFFKFCVFLRKSKLYLLNRIANPAHFHSNWGFIVKSLFFDNSFPIRTTFLINPNISIIKVLSKLITKIKHFYCWKDLRNFKNLKPKRVIITSSYLCMNDSLKSQGSW